MIYVGYNGKISDKVRILHELFKVTFLFSLNEYTACFGDSAIQEIVKALFVLLF